MTVPMRPIDGSDAPKPTKTRRTPTTSQASRKGIGYPSIGTGTR